jgi:hypothetical protein
VNCVDLVEFGRRKRLLGSNDFDVVGDASVEALAGEVEGFTADLEMALGDLELVGGSLEIEVGVTDVAFDLALGVFELGLTLGEGGVRFFDVSFGAAALPNRDVEGGGGTEGGAGLGWVGSDGSVVTVDGERGQTLVSGGGERVFGGVDLSFGDADVGATVARPMDGVVEGEGRRGGEGDIVREVCTIHFLK